MKIHIFYRHYNVTEREPHRPEWFSYEKCLLSLLRNTSHLPLINLIYDGKDINDNWINKYSDQFEHIYQINAGSDAESFFQTCHIIKNDSNIDENDLIYFLENDYMHVEEWDEKIFELFKRYNMDGIYVSLMDHLDKYTHPMYEQLVSKIIVTDNHHWRTTPSTCSSFIVNKKTFDMDYDILSTTKGDHNKFLWLNENRQRIVLSPIPSLSCHAMPVCIPPTIQWQNI